MAVVWNTQPVWEIIVKCRTTLDDFCGPWEDFAADGCGFFYCQSSQFQNRLGISTRAVAILWEWNYTWVISCHITTAELDECPSEECKILLERYLLPNLADNVYCRVSISNSSFPIPCKVINLFLITIKKPQNLLSMLMLNSLSYITDACMCSVQTSCNSRHSACWIPSCSAVGQAVC